MSELDVKDKDFLEMALARLSGLSSYDDLALAEKQASLADLGLNLRERELSDNYQSALKAREQAQPRLGILDAIGGIITSGPRVRGGIKEPIKYENWMTADERLKLDDAVNQAASERDRNLKSWYQSMSLAKNSGRIRDRTSTQDQRDAEMNDPSSEISRAYQLEFAKFFPNKDISKLSAHAIDKVLNVKGKFSQKKETERQWELKDINGTGVLFDKKTGEIRKIDGVSPRTKTTEGQKVVDKEWAKDYNEWTSGGNKMAYSEIDKLESVAKALETGKVKTGGLTGLFPDRMTDKNYVAAKSDVESTVMNSLRAILGAAFTEKEGQRVISNTWNSGDKTENNLKRVRRLIDNLRSQAQAKDEKSAYYEKNGSLQGFSTTIPKIDDKVFVEKIKVSNGKETFMIDPSDLSDAEKDGFRKVGDSDG